MTPPGGPPPQPQPPQPQQPQQPPSSILLTLQGSVMTSNMITPAVTFNGYPVPARYGPQTIPVHPGPLQIDVHAQWLRRYGEATLQVDVPRGQQVPVFYAAPWHQFTSGSIGHQKQRRKGGLLGLALLAGVLAIAVLFVVLAIVAS